MSFLFDRDPDCVADYVTMAADIAHSAEKYGDGCSGLDEILNSWKYYEMGKINALLLYRDVKEILSGLEDAFIRAETSEE